MRRWFYVSVLSIAAIAAYLFAAQLSRSSDAKETKKSVSKKSKGVSDEPVSLKIVPWGPSQATLDAASEQMLRSAAIQKYVRGIRYRLLSFGSIATDGKGNAETSAPTRYRGVIYDYTNNRTITGEGSLSKPATVAVTVSEEQPLPSNEEIESATEILMNDKEFGPALQDGTMVTYEPMPPLLFPRNRMGQIERTLTIGLRSKSDSKYLNEVVGVNMARGTVMKFDEGAPPTSLASPEACGVASSGQSSTANGTAGSYQITVNQGQTVLWDFLAIRPSASSGASSERSGIELQNVKYLGKTVLKRGHVPVLNVQYDGNVCGPFRDWQYSENMFQTDSTNCTDVGPGFRQCTTPATTVLESGNDTGNFKGVAVYTQGTEIVLVTELTAGWYRYIHEWRLDADGTIRPRYGFGATNNSCVCSAHHHHVYWRFDFDINGAEKNSVYENALEGGYYQPLPISTEGKFYRTQPTAQSWLVRNTSSGDAYRIVPGKDGTALNDTFGKGDLWVLKYQSSAGSPTELNDPNTDSSANIDAWLTGESVVNQDIVIWYGGHYLHSDGANIIENMLDVRDTFNVNIISGDHVIGPDLIPVNW
jgi:hypothetical protein